MVWDAHTQTRATKAHGTRGGSAAAAAAASDKRHRPPGNHVAAAATATKDRRGEAQH